MDRPSSSPSSLAEFKEFIISCIAFAALGLSIGGCLSKKEINARLDVIEKKLGIETK